MSSAESCQTSSHLFTRIRRREEFSIKRVESSRMPRETLDEGSPIFDFGRDIANDRREPGAAGCRDLTRGAYHRDRETLLDQQPRKCGGKVDRLVGPSDRLKESPTGKASSPPGERPHFVGELTVLFADFQARHQA